MSGSYADAMHPMNCHRVMRREASPLVKFHQEVKSQSSTSLDGVGCAEPILERRLNLDGCSGGAGSSCAMAMDPARLRSLEDSSVNLSGGRLRSLDDSSSRRKPSFSSIPASAWLGGRRSSSSGD